MNHRFQTFVYGTAIALMIGWIFFIGRDVFVPIMFSVFVVYVILGLARLIARIPLLGPALPPFVISILSVLIIAFGLFMVVYTLLANKDSVIAQGPALPGVAACCSPAGRRFPAHRIGAHVDDLAA